MSNRFSNFRRGVKNTAANYGFGRRTVDTTHKAPVASPEDTATSQPHNADPAGKAVPARPAVRHKKERKVNTPPSGSKPVKKERPSWIGWLLAGLLLLLTVILVLTSCDPKDPVVDTTPKPGVSQPADNSTAQPNDDKPEDNSSEASEDAAEPVASTAPDPTATELASDPRFEDGPYVSGDEVNWEKSRTVAEGLYGYDLSDPEDAQAVIDLLRQNPDVVALLPGGQANLASTNDWVPYQATQNIEYGEMAYEIDGVSYWASGFVDPEGAVLWVNTKTGAIFRAHCLNPVKEVPAATGAAPSFELKPQPTPGKVTKVVEKPAAGASPAPKAKETPAKGTVVTIVQRGETPNLPKVFKPGIIKVVECDCPTVIPVVCIEEPPAKENPAPKPSEPPAGGSTPTPTPSTPSEEPTTPAPSPSPTPTPSETPSEEPTPTPTPTPTTPVKEPEPKLVEVCLNKETGETGTVPESEAHKYPTPVGDCKPEVKEPEPKLVEVCLNKETGETGMVPESEAVNYPVPVANCNKDHLPGKTPEKDPEQTGDAPDNGAHVPPVTAEPSAPAIPVSDMPENEYVAPAPPAPVETPRGQVPAPVTEQPAAGTPVNDAPAEQPAPAPVDTNTGVVVVPVPEDAIIPPNQGAAPAAPVEEEFAWPGGGDTIDTTLEALQPVAPAPAADLAAVPAVDVSVSADSGTGSAETLAGDAAAPAVTVDAEASAPAAGW